MAQLGSLPSLVADDIDDLVRRCGNHWLVGWICDFDDREMDPGVTTTGDHDGVESSLDRRHCRDLRLSTSSAAHRSLDASQTPVTWWLGMKLAAAPLYRADRCDRPRKTAFKASNACRRKSSVPLR